MGKFTEEVTRSCQEIKAGHKSRKELQERLERFLAELKQNMLEKRANFQKEHQEMAQRTKAECLKFIQNIRERVLHIQRNTDQWRKAFASDLEGARQAWREP